jgi:hypothetical protein
VLRDYVWWSAQDAIDYADGQLFAGWTSTAHGARCHVRNARAVPARRTSHQTDLLGPEGQPHLALDLVQRFERGLRELARGLPATGKASRRRR